MIFESLPTAPRSGEPIDKVFSRIARTRRARQNKLEAQQSILQTVSNILSDNLENVIVEWPDFETVDPFYYELADVIVDVGEVRKSLSEVMWASRQVDSIVREYQPKLRKTDVDLACKYRKQALTRMASVVEKVEDDLFRIGEARGILKDLSDIHPDELAIVVVGCPNVGKSLFVNDVIRAPNETARYPFTTKGVQIGHFDHDHIRYQTIGTPGLLDRPEDECNDIEWQVVSALEHLTDAVLLVVDAGGARDYPIEPQLEFRDAVKARFEERGIPVLTVCNKSDRSTDMNANIYMSVETDENVETVLDATVEAIGFEPNIPPSRNE